MKFVVGFLSNWQSNILISMHKIVSVLEWKKFVVLRPNFLIFYLSDKKTSKLRNFVIFLNSLHLIFAILVTMQKEQNLSKK